MGNHTYGQREIYDFIDEAKRLVRPANFPDEAPELVWDLYKLMILNLQLLICKEERLCQILMILFKKADQLVKEAQEQTPFIFVDFHAETTSEKYAMGWHLDGRASAVVGTHTHIQTADERILPKGTGYITDVGMTGFYDGILGINKTEVIERFITSLPQRHVVPNEGRSVLSGVVIDLDKEGKTKHIERILINDDHPFSTF